MFSVTVDGPEVGCKGSPIWQNTKESATEDQARGNCGGNKYKVLIMRCFDFNTT